MKAIVVMFDSLNRHFLPPYGCGWVHAPNFQRLAERTVKFERSYVCSMPCMPARRELHTARPNFLHRSWGPLEPFDDSVPEILRQHGIYTHLVSDHYHYWEDGGCTYHTRYSTWEFMRGQEGDPWIGQVADPVWPTNAAGRNASRDRMARQDLVNRQYMRLEHEMCQARTMAAGIDFIRRNHRSDRWMLHIETFDPHEPFYSDSKYKWLYAEHYRKYRGRMFDWPRYNFRGDDPPELVEHLRYEYASLVSMCDAWLGKVLDVMDELDMWKDTMLIVLTDHGFMLGEHECYAKIWMPFYEEVAHTPFFVWDPRSGRRGESRRALVQPALDTGPTLLELFDVPATPRMLGRPLAQTIADDTPVRPGALFGIHGGQVNVTDGRCVYMRAAVREDNQPLYQYTVMPTHMSRMFSVEELSRAQLAGPFDFTQGCPVLKIPAGRFFGTHPDLRRNLLYDLETDPHQEHAISDPAVENRMIGLMKDLMRQCEAPEEQYERLGLT